MQTIKHQPLTARVKAKSLNEDLSIYGTFAEIGAGQEVASAFFKVGGASKTIAKTMSAYDMTFSDTIYGKEKSGRYVVENRLHKMLEREYSLLEKRIGDKMDERRFFVFANTIATKSPKRGRPGHGWLGCMFQLEPGGPVHKIVLHVHLFESMVESQQNLIGVLGVNLVYGAFNYPDKLIELLESLKDGLNGRKFHIDVIKVFGPTFADVDNRALNLNLLSLGLTNAILFNEKAEIESASDRFYNQSLLVARGRFRPPTNQTSDMLKNGIEMLRKEDDAQVQPFCELTFNHLVQKEHITDEDFLFRLDMISALNMPVLISNFEYHYSLADYLSMFTSGQVAFVLGVDNLLELFKEEHYSGLPGGILEALGRLFKKRFKVYLYPKLGPEEKIFQGQDLLFPAHLDHLFKSLWCQHLICDFDEFNEEVLRIHAEDVLEKIRNRDESWKQEVPTPVAEQIEKHLELIDRRVEKV